MRTKQEVTAEGSANMEVREQHSALTPFPTAVILCFTTRGPVILHLL